MYINMSVSHISMYICVYICIYMAKYTYALSLLGQPRVKDMPV